MLFVPAQFPMPTHYSNAREAMPAAPPPVRSNRMVSPRQGISPRPTYSWRSRYMEPNGLSSGLSEAARLPPSRMGGSGTPTAPSGPAGASTPSLGRNNSAQRSFKPVLQKRDSRDGRMWPRGHTPSSARSTSADRRRPRVAPVRRPCRTLSPPEPNRAASRGPCRTQSSYAPPLATPPVGGSGCPHRFRGAAFEGNDNLVRRVPPTSSPPVHNTMPRVAPPRADFDTPRSPSLKEESRRSSPSTVPQVLSGTPGSDGPKVLPDFEHLCGTAGATGCVASEFAAASGAVTSQQPPCFEHNWKFNLDADLTAARGSGGVGVAGVHADFVHVDTDELPNGLQDLRRAHAAAPGPGFTDSAGRRPLSEDCSNLLVSEASAELSNVSFNLSPIKRSTAGVQPLIADSARMAIDFATSAVCKCGKGSACRCCSRPPSPLQGLHAPPAAVETIAAPSNRDVANRENRPPAEPASKVAAMRNLWEQRSGSSTPNGRGRSSSLASQPYNVVVGRGRCTSREGLVHGTSFQEEQLRRTSLNRIGENMCKRLKKEEEETKKYTQCLDTLISRLDRPGCEYELSPEGEQLDCSINDSLSDGSQEQDSPTTKMCRSLSKNMKASWKSQRHLTQVVMKVLAMDAGLPGRAACQCCTGACTGGACTQTPLPRGLGAEAVPANISLPLPMLTSQVEPLPVTQGLQPLELPEAKADFQVAEPDARFGFCGELVRDGSLQESLPASPQPDEEADGPLPRKSGTEDTVLPGPLQKGKLLAAEDAERVVVDGSRNSTRSDVEPAREPQPLGQSPRTEPLLEDISEVSTDTPLLESPGGATSSSAIGRPSASGPEHEEGLVTEADSSVELNSSGSGDASAVIEEEVSFIVVRPGEDGMERVETLLHAIEQGELKRELYIMVPDGMQPDRKVTFNFENKTHEVQVPEGYEVGGQVLITLTNRPFLERTAAQACRRGHMQPEFPERWSIIDNLRHSLRTDAESSTLASDEFKNRYNLYNMLRGKCGTPLLPFTAEETPSEAAFEMEEEMQEEMAAAY